ncbi:MAG: T9SS type A sorting domain-containing protein [bacterium]
MVERIPQTQLASSRLLATALVVVWSTLAAGQSYFERVISGVPVEREGERMTFPFFGGLGRFLPQFADLDGDGDADLFVLKPFLSAQDKRLEGRLLLFENLGGAPFPELQAQPDFYHDLNVHNWFYFLDLDADGDLDLLHDNGDRGLAYRRNIGAPQRADFALVTEAMTGRNGQPVLSEFTSLPAFCDIDADGDFDFFTGLAIGTIALYRNIGSAAAPLFEFETSRWEDLVILSGTEASEYPMKLASSSKHGANGIDFRDLDHDGDFDFFYGDFFHKSVYYLQNNGSPQDPQVAITDTLWPPQQPALTLGFNIPRFADWDEDGDPDFFAASLNQDRNHFLYYTNEGSATAPALRPVTDHFLTMIDVGSYSAPAFADLEGDGDQDLMIGNLAGNLVYYENTGTTSAPAFRWVTDAFQGLRVRGSVAHPAFADIDDDGDWDLFAGSFDGFVAFFENRGSWQAPEYVLQNPEFEAIDVGLAAAPNFADLDQDRDYDLAVGSEAGTITLYENTGTRQVPHLVSRVSIAPGPEVNDTSPFVFDWNADGIEDLLVGQRNGRILYYEGTGAPGGMGFELRSTEFAGLRAGAASTPALVYLNGDDFADAILGEEAGGLNYYRALPGNTVHEPHSPPAHYTLQVYPNPFRKELHIILHVGGRPAPASPRVAIFNLNGRCVAELAMQKHAAGTWSAHRFFPQSGLAAGIYFVQTHWDNLRDTRKILLVR